MPPELAPKGPRSPASLLPRRGQPSPPGSFAAAAGGREGGTEGGRSPGPGPGRGGGARACLPPAVPPTRARLGSAQPLHGRGGQGGCAPAQRCALPPVGAENKGAPAAARRQPRAEPRRSPRPPAAAPRPAGARRLPARSGGRGSRAGSGGRAGRRSCPGPRGPVRGAAAGKPAQPSRGSRGAAGKGAAADPSQPRRGCRARLRSDGRGAAPRHPVAPGARRGGEKSGVFRRSLFPGRRLPPGSEQWPLRCQGWFVRPRSRWWSGVGAAVPSRLQPGAPPNPVLASCRVLLQSTAFASEAPLTLLRRPAFEVAFFCLQEEKEMTFPQS